MRDNVPSSFASTARTISAKLKIYLERPDFTKITLTGELSIEMHTAQVISGNSVRRFVFKTGDMAHFYTAAYTLSLSAASIALAYTAFNMPSTTAPASENFRSVSCAKNSASGV